jgi:Chromate transporter
VPRVPLMTVLREWGRIGCIGFGGPPAHIRLLRQLCVERKGWLDAREFEDAIAVCNLMPGPASTQLVIFCAWRRAGALLDGAAFIRPRPDRRPCAVGAVRGRFPASVGTRRGAGAGRRHQRRCRASSASGPRAVAGW